MARRTRRAAAVVGTVALSVVGAAALAGAAAAAVSVLVARTIVTPPVRRPDDVRILASGRAGVTLSADAETVVPGRYGLFFSHGAGYARLGEVVGRGPDWVTRTVDEVVTGDLDAARGGRWSGWYHLGPADLGYPWEDAAIPTEFGDQPAWLVPAAEPTGRWAVLVHGRAVTRAETLRAVRPLREAGWTTLLISYRNDPESPASGDGRYALGDREWHDVDAAMRWAIEHGAEELLLLGYSMGGATVLQAATRSDLRDRVSRIVLDSPVIDWNDVIARQGRVRRLPPAVIRTVPGLLSTPLTGRATGLAAPVDLARLDWVTRAAELRLPVLLLHSRGDGFVPSGPSERLAAARPDLVTLELFDTAQHTRLWNYDPERWEGAVREFATGPAQPPTGRQRA